MKMLRASVAAGVAFVIGSAGALCVAAMGLVVTAFAAWPLTLGLAALLAALAAVWVGNLGTPDRARLLPAVAVALGAAAAILAGGLALDAALGGRFMTGGPLVLTLGACMAGVAAGSGASAVLLRGPRGRLGFGGVASLVVAFCGLICAYLVSPFGLSPLAGLFLLPYPVLAGATSPWRWWGSLWRCCGGRCQGGRSDATRR